MFEWLAQYVTDPQLSAREIEAYQTYRTARLTFTQPWALWGERFSIWWQNRVLLYDKIEGDVEKHIYDKMRTS